jgi:alpha-L-fucosidase
MDKWGKPGLIHYKFDAMAFGTAVIDVERGQFGALKAFPWQTDTSIARNSWSYTENNDVKKAPEILCDFIDIVSKNGCLLLNVGPKADGTIADEEKKVLLEIGDWLKVNGEAVYNTATFKVFGEGPTQVFIREGDFTDSKEKGFTSEDIRFTQNGGNLYAVVLKYPENGVVNIKSLGRKSTIFYGSIEDIEVLGFEEKPVFELLDDKLAVNTKSVKSENPVVFKIKID